eukprot:scaffold1498_cov163-Amphora_coffeaeformis.AAC.4
MAFVRKQADASTTASSCGGGGGKMNQIFILTCIASLALQLFSIMASWDGGRRLGEKYPMYSNNMPPMSDYASPVSVLDKSNQVGAINNSNHQVDVHLPERLQMGPPKHSRRLRVLFGILTADFKNDETYRKRHRTLFKLWNDKRVCALHEFKQKPLEDRYECELIYTFVIAANPNETTELVDNSRPFEVARPIRGECKDLNEPDMTLLNIK